MITVIISDEDVAYSVSSYLFTSPTWRYVGISATISVEASYILLWSLGFVNKTFSEALWYLMFQIWRICKIQFIKYNPQFFK